MIENSKPLRRLKNLHDIYILSCRTIIPFEDFIVPSRLIKHHKEVTKATVFKKYDRKYKHYPYFMYFGCMFFFNMLTNLEIYETEKN